jgi:hypothetical protein
MGLYIRALALDAMAPAEKPMVMVARRLGLRLCTRRCVGRVVVAKRTRHHDRGNG